MKPNKDEKPVSLLTSFPFVNSDDNPAMWSFDFKTLFGLEFFQPAKQCFETELKKKDYKVLSHQIKRKKINYYILIGKIIKLWL